MLQVGELPRKTLVELNEKQESPIVSRSAKVGRLKE
jgi:hypothetical protein